MEETSQVSARFHSDVLYRTRNIYNYDDLTPQLSNYNNLLDIVQKLYIETSIYNSEENNIDNFDIIEVINNIIYFVYKYIR